MVDGFAPGERRFFFSKGQFSLVDLAVALTAITGPASFQCAVWTGTKSSLEQIGTLADSGRITEARWVLCDSQRDMNEDRLKYLLDIFGVDQVRVVPLHAKIMTLRNDDWAITVQSSANMTLNRSVEQFDVTDSEKLFGFVDRFFDEVFAETPTLAEEPPFDGFSYEQVEQRYQSLCVGNHLSGADPMDAAPLGVVDGLR